MYCDRRGNGQKPAWTKPLGQKPPRTIEIEFVQGTFVWDFCTRPTKNRGGGPECVTYFRGGVPGCGTKGDGGRGVKIGQKYRDVLYGRPLLSSSRDLSPP